MKKIVAITISNREYVHQTPPLTWMDTVIRISAIKFPVHLARIWNQFRLE
jgi:hypothetical protein